jgi:hypothetical protein
MKKGLIGFFATFISVWAWNPASAQSVATGSISNVDVQTANGGKVIFNQGSNRSGVPTCATITNRWAFDGTTPAGQATLSLILSAYMSGKSVTVHGLGNCSAWGDTETVQYIEMP